MLCVRRYLSPVTVLRYAANADELPDCFEFCFTVQIITDVAEQNTPVLRRLGIFNEYGDGDWRTGAFTEYIVFFLTTLFPLSTCIAPQVEYVKA